MSKKYWLVFIISLAAIVLLASCQRSASQNPAASTATTSGGLVALPTNGLSALQMIQTQTALAQPQSSSGETPSGSNLIATSTPFGTPPSFTLVPPTGAAPTENVYSTPIPGTTPIVIVPTATPGIPLTYTLMQGEFPYCIARRFNVNQQELLSLNNITSGQILMPGLVLQIPQTGDPFVGDRTFHPHPTVYTVTSTDDNIYKVACYFGDVDPTSIIAANSLTAPYTLFINQVLNIP
jgi:LysM repeat protein